MKIREFFVFSSTAEGNFSFSRLILKLTAYWVLFSFFAMMAVDAPFSTM